MNLSPPLISHRSTKFLVEDPGWNGCNVRHTVLRLRASSRIAHKCFRCKQQLDFMQHMSERARLPSCEQVPSNRVCAVIQTTRHCSIVLPKFAAPTRLFSGQRQRTAQGVFAANMARAPRSFKCPIKGVRWRFIRQLRTRIENYVRTCVYTTISLTKASRFPSRHRHNGMFDDAAKAHGGTIYIVSAGDRYENKQVVADAHWNWRTWDEQGTRRTVMTRRQPEQHYTSQGRQR